MLRLLLDQHISPDVISAVRRLHTNIPVEHVQDRHWQAVADPDLLGLARREGLTLVTYDQATIPRFLQQLAQNEEDHAGVIFIDTKTIASSNIGGQARALAGLWSREKNADWRNRTCFLGHG